MPPKISHPPPPMLQPVVGEVTVTKLLLYITRLLFKVTSNGFVTFKIAVTNNGKLLNFKIGQWISSNFLRKLLKTRYMVTF